MSGERRERCGEQDKVDRVVERTVDGREEMREERGEKREERGERREERRELPLV